MTLGGPGPRRPATSRRRAGTARWPGAGAGEWMLAAPADGFWSRGGPGGKCLLLHRTLVEQKGKANRNQGLTSAPPPFPAFIEWHPFESRRFPEVEGVLVGPGLPAERTGLDVSEGQPKDHYMTVVVKTVLGSHFGLGEFTGSNVRTCFRGDWDVSQDWVRLPGGCESIGKPQNGARANGHMDSPRSISWFNFDPCPGGVLCPACPKRRGRRILGFSPRNTIIRGFVWLLPESQFTLATV